ncbi:putative Zn finger protein [Orenia metallireducens]|uniref:Uncharacterized conserved protein, contains Zn finger domain n=1 Tax=Orenia metallireducens TaxID=1413210 RepID=A0A285HSU7_9FIRM|nr:SWIM zinc finger family protein [Orenia metallireducens]PRX24056.1 putative Zn finger protein [Orenia metallireducens]SNY38749.1 Uncharacterized conserved protein, contains Zn finger domain [Orenia metallireducens]
MNINDFEKDINGMILERGYNYYHDGNIGGVYKQGDNEYVFEVYGSEEYEVIVEIDGDGKILDSNCNCPYDFGPICKHQVAAYFELGDILNNKNTIEEITRKPAIKEVLETLCKEELIDIIVDIAKKDLTLKNNIILRYSKGNDGDELKKCQNLMDTIVRKYTKREGFIPYRETYYFVAELEELLGKIREIHQNNKLLLALDIAFVVLEEAIEAFQYADDSNGDIGGFVSQVIDLIDEIVATSENRDIKIRGKIFKRLLKESDNRVFDGWGEYRDSIIEISAKFAEIEEFRDELKLKIEDLVSKNLDGFYQRYHSEKLLLILFEIIDEYGSEEEAEEFIKANLEFTAFRELLIEKLIEEKDYSKVIELALEGESKDQQYLGLVSRWKKIRYRAYKGVGLKEEQEILAKELLFSGDFEYYQELKELHKDDEENFYNQIKEELKNDKGWHGKSIYLKLIVEEGDLAELMEFVRENPRTIEKYAEMLIDRYKDEVIEIYKKFIKLEAKSASNRKMYQKVCKKLENYKKIAGKEDLKELINELSITYKRRPAFLDELGKVK